MLEKYLYHQQTVLSEVS